MGFKAIEYIAKKNAGMSACCYLIAKELEKQAKDKAYWKKHTNHAVQGIKGGTDGGNGNYNIYLAHGVDYGEILEEGSKPHVITPKNGKYLYWKGAAHPVKRVNHPGTKGFKTFEKVLEGNRAMVKAAVIKYWSD
ncbi:hypothetical protein NZ45_07935 [Clostridium botulinum]|uniref:HK97 gp10 family phage protein n=1 Tax=Clostridium botulinum TaxID=1491 RepID=A0ABD7CGH1_CLOBO|nr:hypothetical protein [Clostridium botulinum]KGO14281.1 hypothetical protein NZ45_07935 [Clostridium botulinum]QRI52264.1 hypothetical protein JQS73_12585 [Clostridium botulinum]